MAAVIAWAVIENNKTVAYPSEARLLMSLDNSVNWLIENQATLVSQHNPILWWMLKKAGENTGHKELKDFYLNYKKKHIDKARPDVWTPMFSEHARPFVPDITLLDYQPYQHFMVYSLNCDKDYEHETTIQAQMRPGFCSLHYLKPRCITHQMFGLRFMQRYNCGHEQLVSGTIADLQDTIVDELTWDFRVGDAYIQRVLMLTDSGAFHQVKPVWVDRILKAQNLDGGWDDIHPLLSLPDGRVFGLGTTRLKLSEPVSNFHATAQAVWLLSMLLSSEHH